MLKQGRKVNGNFPEFEENYVFHQIYKINGEYEIHNKDGETLGYTSEDDEVIINWSSYKRDQHSLNIISGDYRGYDDLILDNYDVDNMFLMVRD